MKYDFMTELCSLSIFFVDAVMASGITAAPHLQSSPCRCSTGVLLWCCMVLAVAFFCIRSLYFIVVGPDFGCSGVSDVVWGFRCLHDSTLAQG